MKNGKYRTFLSTLLILVVVLWGVAALLTACQKDDVQVMGTTNFDNLGLGDGEAEDIALTYDGNAQNFYIALDDSVDDLLIGLGSVVGTTPGLGIDEDLAVTTYGDFTMGGTTPVLTVGDDGAEDAAIVYDGNAQEFYIALYDTDDDLIIGLGAVVGTTPIMSFDENQIVSIGGNKLDLDADLDTSITVDTDDQIDLEIAGSDEYVLTAAVFDIGEGTLSRIDLDADGDTSVRSRADDEVQLEIGAADEYTFTATIFDVNANEIVLDDDDDTSITADTDDQIDFEIGGSDEFVFTAGILDIATNTLNRIDLDADNDTSFRSRADDEIQLEIGAADEYTFTATVFDVNANEIVLDDDDDTSITADTDDQIDLEIGGANEYTFTATIFSVGGNKIDLDSDEDTSFVASTDDQIDIEIAGATDFQLMANKLVLAAGSIITHAESSDGGVQFAIHSAVAFAVTSTVTVGIIPANADVVNWEVIVATAFDGSGTDLLTCGTSGDPDKYVDDVDLAAAGVNWAGDAADMQNDEWTNYGDVGASASTIQCIYADQNTDAAAGVGTFIIWYILD